MQGGIPHPEALAQVRWATCHDKLTGMYGPSTSGVANNIDYAVRLLKRSVQDANLALKLAGKSELSVQNAVLATDDAYCTAFCHHIEKPSDVVSFERIEFPHTLHTEGIGLPCTQCHSPDKHKMRVITRSECMNCHHEQQDIECRTCHPYQHELFTGNVPEIGVQDQPDVMAAAGLECSSCHDLSQTGEVLSLVSQMCLACHEEGYDKMAIDWHNEFLQKMAEATALLAEARKRIETGEISQDSARTLQQKLQWAENVLNVLEKAKPAHNPMLAEDLLAQLNQALAPIAKHENP